MCWVNIAYTCICECVLSDQEITKHPNSIQHLGMLESPLVIAVSHVFLLYNIVPPQRQGYLNDIYIVLHSIERPITNTRCPSVIFHWF